MARRNQVKYQLQQALALGLREFENDPPDLGAKEYFGKKPSPTRGAVPIEAPSYPVTGGISQDVTYPLPMLLKGTKGNMLLKYNSSSHKLYALNGSWGPGSDLLSSNTLPSVTDDSTSKTIATGTSWQYAERDGYWFISNGNVYMTNHALYNSWAAGLPADVPVPKSFAIHDNRLFMANFNHSGTYFSSGFGADLWDTWNINAPNQILTNEDNVPDARCIIWGLEGGGESSKPFTAEMVALTGYKSADVRELVISACRRWQMGFCFIPWEGVIYSMKSLGKDMMIYGSEGIGVLRQVDTNIYYPELLLNIGLASGSAVAGDNRKHVFLDSRGWLRTVTPGPQIGERRFQEHLSGLLGEDMVISHDDIRHEFYLADNDEGYLLTKEDRLCKTRYQILSVISQANDLYATYIDGGNAKFIFESGEIDLDTRGNKTLEAVEISKKTLTNVSSQVFFKSLGGTTWGNTSAVDFTAAGIVDHMVTALDHRIRVEEETADSENVRYINAIFHEDDGKLGLGEY